MKNIDYAEELLMKSRSSKNFATLRWAEAYSKIPFDGEDDAYVPSLFTGQTDEEGNVLLPSKSNPNIRRWQKPAEGVVQPNIVEETIGGKEEKEGVEEKPLLKDSDKSYTVTQKYWKKTPFTNKDLEKMYPSLFSRVSRFDDYLGPVDYNVVLTMAKELHDYQLKYPTELDWSDIESFIKAGVYDFAVDDKGTMASEYLNTIKDDKENKASKFFHIMDSHKMQLKIENSPADREEYYKLHPEHLALDEIKKRIEMGLYDFNINDKKRASDIVREYRQKGDNVLWSKEYKKEISDAIRKHIDKLLRGRIVTGNTPKTIEDVIVLPKQAGNILISVDEYETKKYRGKMWRIEGEIDDIGVYMVLSLDGYTQRSIIHSKYPTRITDDDLEAYINKKLRRKSGSITITYNNITERRPIDDLERLAKEKYPITDIRKDKQPIPIEEQDQPDDEERGIIRRKYITFTNDELITKLAEKWLEAADESNVGKPSLKKNLKENIIKRLQLIADKDKGIKQELYDNPKLYDILFEYITKQRATPENIEKYFSDEIPQKRDVPDFAEQVIKESEDKTNQENIINTNVANTNVANTNVANTNVDNSKQEVPEQAKKDFADEIISERDEDGYFKIETVADFQELVGDEPITIDTVKYANSPMNPYKETLYKVYVNDSGEVVVDYAEVDYPSEYRYGKQNDVTMTAYGSAIYVDNKDRIELLGNAKKVLELGSVVRGKTIGVKEQLKKFGYRWEPNTKTWRKG